MPLFNNILETIGNTPLINLKSICSEVKASIYGKVEFFNPGTSIKDRAAYNMVMEAEKKGLVKESSIIIEATSGNTGIGLAMVCAVKQYQLLIFMPENASKERRKIMNAFGAKIVLTPKEEGMQGAIQRAIEFKKQNHNVIHLNQFTNLANPAIHTKTTATEIWRDLNGDIDVFVSAVGTGGTITGIGEKLKELKKDIHIIAVEPKKSPILSGGKADMHSLEGMGAGFIPEILNTNIYDEVIAVSEKEAYEACRMIAKLEGILVGKSSGAALAAALIYTKKALREENIVVILPDTGERYLSTELWQEE